MLCLTQVLYKMKWVVYFVLLPVSFQTFNWLDFFYCYKKKYCDIQYYKKYSYWQLLETKQSKEKEKTLEWEKQATENHSFTDSCCPFRIYPIS